MRTKEDIFLEIKKAMEEKGKYSHKVKKAYDKAVFWHADVTRKDGTPYINHPLEVALILAKMSFDADCVSAAILHDTIEDTDYTLEEMEEEFGESVKDIVNAVSEIKPENFNLKEMDPTELYMEEDFAHSTFDTLTISKLISMGKQHPLSFYIKFADRIHNLKTQGTFTYQKQMVKVKETKDWLIPIAEILRSGYFCRELKNECFRITSSELFNEFAFVYNDNLNNTKSNLEFLMKKFVHYFSQINNKTLVEYKVVKEYETFEYLKQRKYLKNLKYISEIQLNNAPVYSIFIVEPVVDVRFNFITKNIFSSFLKLVDIGYDELSNMPYVLMSDNSRVLYKVFHMNASDYAIYNIGNDKFLDRLDEKNTHEINVKTITVFTKDDDIRIIPENSTVLDFAFLIHDDIVLSFKSAEIISTRMRRNESVKHVEKISSATEVFYTKLTQGEKIIIHCNRDKDGHLLPCAKLKWLGYVNLPKSKQTLIRYIKNKYKIIEEN